MARDADALVAHVQHLRDRNLRPQSIYQRQRVLHRLAAYREGRSILTAGDEDLRGFLRRQADPCSRATELSHLRQFYKWALLNSWITRDPTLRLIRPRLPRRLARPMPTGLVARALAGAPPGRVRPMLYLAVYAGLRAIDISGLRAEDLLVHENPRVIFIEEGKGGGSRYEPMPTVLHEALSSDPLLPVSGWLFPRRDGGTGHLPAHMISRIANLYLHGIGIRHTLHTLRHWYGTEVHKISGDMRMTAELMGHESMNSTLIYTRIDRNRAAEVVEQLPVLA